MQLQLLFFSPRRGYCGLKLKMDDVATIIKAIQEKESLEPQLRKNWLLRKGTQLQLLAN